MILRRTFLRPTLLLAFVLTAVFASAAEQYAVTYERGVQVKMRDGVTLRADIYRPQVDGKFPVLLQRTPYNKDNGVEFGIKAAARGYVVIFQDVRGRYASEGDWYVFKNEPNDGYDTVAWYDLFLGGSLRNYLGIKASGGSEEARKGQQLVVVIGGHAGPGPKVGDVDFGPAANEPADQYELRWYDYLFK